MPYIWPQFALVNDDGDDEEDDDDADIDGHEHLIQSAGLPLWQDARWIATALASPHLSTTSLMIIIMVEHLHK